MAGTSFSVFPAAVPAAVFATEANHHHFLAAKTGVERDIMNRVNGDRLPPARWIANTLQLHDGLALQRIDIRVFGQETALNHFLPHNRPRLATQCTQCWRQCQADFCADAAIGVSRYLKRVAFQRRQRFR